MLPAARGIQVPPQPGLAEGAEGDRTEEKSRGGGHYITLVECLLYTPWVICLLYHFAYEAMRPWERELLTGEGRGLRMEPILGTL